MDDPQDPPRNSAVLAVRVLAVLGLLFGFLIAIRLLGSSIKLMGKGAAGTLFDGVDNPFAGLAVGILATVLVQSSSTTTSTIVGLVGSSAMKLKTAVPMIMGANIGTTVTNTLVSIGHVRRGLEFRRAFACATVHDFFNLMCVAAFLPLEVATGFLQTSATKLTTVLQGGGGGKMESPIKDAVKWAYGLIKGAFESLGLTGTGLALTLLGFGIALTFFCLIFITKNMKILISGPLERALNRSLGKSGWIGIGIGTLVTISVQSSSITTSLLVPMCAAGVLTLQNAFPIMLGANIGTTVTGLIASMATDEPEGLTIALVHCLFNVAGVVIFYSIPAMRRIPIKAAETLAAKASGNPVWLVLYVIVVFVIIPLVGWLLFREASGG